MDARHELNRTGDASVFEPFWPQCNGDRLALSPLCIGNGVVDREWEELDDDADVLADLLFGPV